MTKGVPWGPWQQPEGPTPEQEAEWERQREEEARRPPPERLTVGELMRQLESLVEDDVATEDLPILLETQEVDGAIGFARETPVVDDGYAVRFVRLVGWMESGEHGLL